MLRQHSRIDLSLLQHLNYTPRAVFGGSRVSKLGRVFLIQAPIQTLHQRAENICVVDNVTLTVRGRGYGTEVSGEVLSCYMKCNATMMIKEGGGGGGRM